MTEEEYYTKPLWHLISNRDKTMIVCDTMENVNNKVHLNWSSCSPGYETEEELHKAEGILEKPCIKCGRIISTAYRDSTTARLIEKNICFSCDFWSEKMSIKDLEKVARINGSHYMIERDDSTAYFRGYSGAEFKIRFNDGREVITHNLWFQGDIPEHFRDDLPDNAVFIQS